MTILAFPSLLAAIASITLGGCVHARRPKSEPNRAFFLFSIAAAYWGFTDFGLQQSETYETAYIWLRMGALWPIAIVLLLHFVLVFTHQKKILEKKTTYYLMYVPAVLISIVDLTSNLIIGNPERGRWGWEVGIAGNPLLHDISYTWGAVVAVMAIYLCLRYYLTVSSHKTKQQAKFVLIGLGIPVATGVSIFTANVLLGTDIPQLILPSYIVGSLFIAYAIMKYELFELNPTTAADNIISIMSDIFLLVDPSGTITATNRSTVASLRYEERELLGQDIGIILPEEERDAFKERAFHELQKALSISDFETVFASKTGERIPISLSASAVRDEKGELQGIVYIGRDIAERKKAEDQIKAALKEKELLFKEIHHRVKNNMQIISSLLFLQSRYVSDERTQGVLADCQNRIKSMALIYERLCESRDVTALDFREYIRKLVEDLVRSYSPSDQRIKVITDIDSTLMEVDPSIYCGLIINELVSNSLRHAFPDGRSGEIRIAFHSVGEEVELLVSDTGEGIPEDIDIRDTRTLGLRLVTMLAEDQLRGTISLRRSGGTEFRIRFRYPQ
jgi:PAS domain S-box-containing protein